MKYKKYVSVILLIFSVVFIAPGALDALLDEKVSQVTKKTNHKVMGGLLRTLYGVADIPLEKLPTLDFIDDKVIQSGKLEMQKHRAVITGIARDNIVDLPIMIRHIEYLGEFFADYRVIIFENDSVDGTAEALFVWSKRNPKVRVISETYANKKRPSIGFLAEIRNKYLDAMKASEYDEFDIMIPIDMDMSYGFDIRGIFDSFSKFSHWGAMCSNGVSAKAGVMYDTFAFRNDKFPYGPNDLSGYEYFMELLEGQKFYNPQSDLVPVYSCFGGMAIYKREFVKDCNYTSDRDDCEHVLFNKCVRDNGAKMFMNPAQLLKYSDGAPSDLKWIHLLWLIRKRLSHFIGWESL